MKKHNFYAGPSILPEITKEKTAGAAINFAETGLSVMEVSHRSKEFVAVMDEAQALVKELLKVPEGYSVLFLQGGASLQFLMAPYNLMNKKAAYLNTGAWSKKAIKEAKFFGEVVEVASSADANFNYIPKGFEVPSDVDYLHITTNNTIFGTEILSDLNVSVPLLADMSSDIFSRPMDVSKYDLIYAGAQKNLGPSGATLVIVKDDALGKMERPIPTILNYKTHIDNGSMFNTPATLPVFACLQTLRWLKENGGLEAMEKTNIAKAKVLYDELDRNKLFKANIPNSEDRSLMNVTFVMTTEYAGLEKEFLEFATGKGMVGIKGHRSVGGFRASIYNAMPVESIEALVETMQEFEKMN
ncbi:MAG: 3-phosphoserine/phosphohydroxythreonine transaminase [Prolixibacteraceae bacterium]|jgi:phosphoserine aminotransferase|nr:3-phosphoserine/phosphohydroxythreonine transaminase [Prolixibacteraceae bacterium]MBT6767047.1 3-phosphoserine/phosphohydroxythreonine transaminase [Prolixibacteraceae bacterium]MBT6998819.1 3-phosphoserine/phosphohydroxythreonine transaminase [Prolixibacteraceae bacterium]MBT7396787.1 3-phosphoserine/phosphohydroxythreonine transaminase [Prolixibacteraceae bacterium]